MAVAAALLLAGLPGLFARRLGRRGRLRFVGKAEFAGGERALRQRTPALDLANLRWRKHPPSGCLLGGVADTVAVLRHRRLLGAGLPSCSARRERNRCRGSGITLALRGSLADRRSGLRPQRL